VAIVDAEVRTLFEGTVRPNYRIELVATRIHGHTGHSLADSPPFWEVYPDLLEALWDAGSTVTTNTLVNTVYANIPGSSSRTTSAWSTGIPACRACSIIASTLGASYSQ
jgi:hypothetical protein